LGANVGGAWAHDQWHFDFAPIPGGSPPPTDRAALDESGVVGGGQIGCDYQTGPFVFGVEGMFDGMSLTGSGSDPFESTLIEGDKYRWLGTLTGRIGYALDRVLIYAKGGGAWVNAEHSLSGFEVGSLTQTSSGWVAGAGIEWAFAPQWSVKFEYNHIETSPTSTFNALVPGTPALGVLPITFDFNQRIDMVTAGVNYRFHW
jgi:outer membrane immunogenic protein